MDLHGIKVKDGDVILIRDDSVASEYFDIDALAGDLHEKYPNSLVICLSEQGKIETMPTEELRFLLESLIEHQETVDAAH